MRIRIGDLLVKAGVITGLLLKAARAELTGDPDVGALAVVPADTAEEFGLVPIALKDQGRTLLVAMSDPLNISATDHLVSLTGGRKVETRLAGASAIRPAVSRWYRGEEVLRDDGEQSMKIVNNAGDTVEGTGRAVAGIGARGVKPPAA